MTLVEVGSGELELQFTRRAQGGDRQAFDWLMQRHLKAVYNLILRMLAGDRETAQDLVQDTFLSAFRSLAQFRRESRIATWFHRIAVNKVLNHRARRKWNVTDIDPIREMPDSGPEPIQQLEEAELHRLMEKAVAGLPESLASVFILRELQKKSYEEVAEILETTPEAVRVRLHRAKKELLKRLKPYLGVNDALARA
ncbi:sigma-70 family RNA polymerase sigma factor [bacterium]|nr:sigma-70 family RNA polymerase sigma factor [bacterium]